MTKAHGESFQIENSWRKSSWNVGDGDCIEVATGDYGIMIRDSKDRGGPILKFTADSWVSLLETLRSEGSLVLSD